MNRISNILKKEVVLDGKSWYVAVMLYIYIAVLSFAIGWMKPILALVVCAAVIYALQKAFRELWIETHFHIRMKMGTLLIIFVLILVLGYYLGWGGFTPQAGDWYKHNMVMNDLVTKSWPVYYENGSEKSMLTYYIGQYIVPALVGKIFGGNVHAAYIFQYFWLCLGLLLVAIGLIKVLKLDTQKKQLLAFLILTFFGSLLLVGQTILYVINPEISSLGIVDHWLCMDYLKIQYTTNFVLMRWVYPQCIVPWMLTIILYERQDDFKNYIVWFLPLILYATLPALGLIILLFLCFCKKISLERDKIITILKECFSLQNIVMLSTCGGMIGVYLSGNIFQSKIASMSVHLIDYSGRWVIYFLFIVFTYGIDMLLVYKSERKQVLYWGAFLEILILPFFTMGTFNDFTMRVSIPALFLLMIYLIKCLFDNNSGEKQIRVAIIICLVIGAIYPLKELGEVIRDDEIKKLDENANNGITSLQSYATRDSKQVKDVGDKGLQYNYYTYDIENSFFEKYIARKTFYQTMQEEKKKSFEEAEEKGVLLCEQKQLKIYYYNNSLVYESEIEDFNKYKLYLEYGDIQEKYDIYDEEKKEKCIYGSSCLQNKEVENAYIMTSENERIYLFGKEKMLEFDPNEEIEMDDFHDKNWNAGVIIDGGMIIFTEFDQRLFSLKDKSITFDNGQKARIVDLTMTGDGFILLHFDTLLDATQFTDKNNKFTID